MAVGFVMGLRHGRPMRNGSIVGMEKNFVIFHSVHLIFSEGVGCLSGWVLTLTTHFITSTG
jgi:hypothetical protein